MFFCRYVEKGRHEAEEKPKTPARFFQNADIIKIILKSVDCLVRRPLDVWMINDIAERVSSKIALPTFAEYRRKSISESEDHLANIAERASSNRI